MNVTMPTVGWNRQFGDRNISVDLRRLVSNSFTLDAREHTYIFSFLREGKTYRLLIGGIVGVVALSIYHYFIIVFDFYSYSVIKISLFISRRDCGVVSPGSGHWRPGI